MGQFTRMLNEIMKMDNEGFDATSQSYFSKIDKSIFVNDKDEKEKKKKKEGEALNITRASGNLSEQRKDVLGYSGEEEAPFMTVDEIIHRMDDMGYKKVTQGRTDKWQSGYTPSNEEIRLFNTYATKDIQKFMGEAGYPLNDFGEDNVFGFETGAAVSKLTTPYINPVEPNITDIEKDVDIENRSDVGMKRVFQYEPSVGQWYSAEPNTEGRESNEKSFVQMNIKQIRGWGKQFGFTEKRMDEIIKDEGESGLAEKLNDKQGINNNMKQFYISNGKFPVYKNKKLKDRKQIYDFEGKLLEKPKNLEY